MIDINMSFTEYDKMVKESANFKKAVDFLNEALGYFDMDENCPCPKCDRINEMKEFVQTNGC